jgi:hypothetical protein
MAMASSVQREQRNAGKKQAAANSFEQDSSLSRWRRGRELNRHALRHLAAGCGDPLGQ